MERIEKAAKLANRIVRLLGLKTPPKETPVPIIPLSMHGDGSLTVHEMQKPNKP
jgi:hypothetical protein